MSSQIDFNSFSIYQHINFVNNQNNPYNAIKFNNNINNNNEGFYANQSDQIGKINNFPL